MSAAMRSIADVYGAMSKIEELAGVDRVLLLEISNGGDKPMPGSKMYAKAVEVFATDQSRAELLDRYKKVNLDNSYIRMVIEAESKAKDLGHYAFDVERHEDCILKAFYVNEGVLYSEIYHVHTDADAKAMFIISVASKHTKEHFEKPATRQAITARVTEIRNNFELWRHG